MESGGAGLVPSLEVTGGPFSTEMSTEEEEASSGQEAGNRPGQSQTQGDQARPEFQPKSPQPDFCPSVHSPIHSFNSSSL